MARLHLILACAFAVQAAAVAQPGKLVAMSARVLRHGVRVNESVDIECTIQAANGSRSFNVYWGKLISEKETRELTESCFAYQHPTHAIICDNANPNLATKFTLRIKSVQWSDRGLYTCRYANNATSVFLDVTEPSKIASFAASELDGPALPGHGTRLSPYWPAPGAGFSLTCRTTCSWPLTRPRLAFQRLDRTSATPGAAPPVGQLDSSDAMETVANCSVSAGARLSLAAVTVRVGNCSQFGLDGRIRFLCIGGDESYGKRSEIFITCPVIFRDFPLTQGEIAAVSVGSVLALVFIAIGFVIFCRSNHAVDGKSVANGYIRPVAV